MRRKRRVNCQRRPMMGWGRESRCARCVARFDVVNANKVVGSLGSEKAGQPSMDVHATNSQREELHQSGSQGGCAVCKCVARIPGPEPPRDLLNTAQPRKPNLMDATVRSTAQESQSANVRTVTRTMEDPRTFQAYR